MEGDEVLRGTVADFIPKDDLPSSCDDAAIGGTLMAKKVSTKRDRITFSKLV